MKVGPRSYRAIWVKPEDPSIVQIIDQRALPHQLVVEDLKSHGDMIRAIKEMHLRGAPLIGVAAAYGIYLAVLEAPKDNTFGSFVQNAARGLLDTRPTARNLMWALEQMRKAIDQPSSFDQRSKDALKLANELAEAEVLTCQKIGEHGLELIRQISKRKKGDAVHVLTHCNAGWLACVDWGTATAPIYMAHDQGIKVHVWVDETRPRNQGAGLTAWELAEHGVPHTVIVDNAGGHLMQHGMVDAVFVGTDRVSRGGDVANKIGTYLKALAARDNQVPFYVAAPSSSIDWNIRDGVKEIPIEERSGEEVKYVEGLCDGKVKRVLIMPEASAVKNFGFDVTPARLITALITERGVCGATEKDLLRLFPEHA